MPGRTERFKRLADPQTTQIAHGYAQADPVASFIAPLVPVTSRYGNTITFGKDEFAVIDATRAPRGTIERVSPDFGVKQYSIEQKALASSVAFEEDEEASSAGSRFNLRVLALNHTLGLLAQSWENEVLTMVSNANLYEPTLVTTLATAADKLTSSTSDPELVFEMGKEAVRSQCGIYPNAAVLSPDAYFAIRRHEKIKDRIKSSESPTADVLASILDLPQGIRVARRVKLNANGTLENMFDNKILLFYRPEEELAAGFIPGTTSSRARPSFAYTYGLEGYPVVEEERVDENTREYLSDVIIEQSVQLTGLGVTGKAAAGYLITGVTK